MRIMSPFRVVTFSLVIVLLAGLCVRELNIDLNRQTKTNIITVSFGVSDSTPELIEQKVSSVLENVLSQIRDLKHIRSISAYGYGAVELSFDDNIDMDAKRFEILSILRQVQDKLPPGVEFPNISDGNYEKSTSQKEPLLIYSVNGNISDQRTRHVIERVFQKTLLPITEISRIEVSGVNSRQLSIKFDKDILRAHDLDLTGLMSSLKRSVMNSFPGYTSNSNGENLFIQIPAQTLNISDIENLLVSDKNIRLKDVSEIYMEEQSPKEYFRVNGKTNVTVNIYGREGVNGIILAKAINKMAVKIRENLPSDLDLRLDLDSTQFIKEEMAKNGLRLLMVFSLLCVMILAFYKRCRTLFIVLLSALVNICLVVIVYAVLKIQINIHTLPCLTISLGVIMNITMIFIESYRLKTSSKIVPTLIISAIITSVTLLLAHYFGGNNLYTDTSFGIAISVVLLTSIITNVVFTAGVYKLLESDTQIAIPTVNKLTWFEKLFMCGDQLLIEYAVRFKKIFIVLLIFLFGTPVFLLPVKIEGQTWYNDTIGTDTYQDRVRPYIDVFTGGVWRLFKVFVYENSQNLDAGQTILHVDAELPVGNTIQQMDHILRRVEHYLSGFKGIDKYVTRIKSGQSAEMKVTFSTDAPNALPNELKEALTKKVLELGGVGWKIYGVGKGFSNKTLTETPVFKIQMAGYNFDELEQQAKMLSASLKKNERIPEVDIDAKESFDQMTVEELVLSLKINKLGLRGIDNYQLFLTLKDLSKPTNFHSAFQYDGESVPIVFKEKNSEEFSKWDMLNSKFSIKGSGEFRLDRYGEMDLKSSSGAIIKENREYIRLLELNYMGSFETGALYIKQVLTGFKKQLPTGYSARIDLDEAYDSNRLDPYFLILMVVIVNFVLCAIFFENLRIPILILILVPISCIGTMFSYYILDVSFDQGGYAAFLLTGCYVIGSGILLLSNLKEEVSATGSDYRGIINSIQQQHKKILLSAIFIILGMLPFLAIEGNEVFWTSFIFGSIGGIFAAIFAVFVVLPVFLIGSLKSVTMSGMQTHSGNS